MQARRNSTHGHSRSLPATVKTGPQSEAPVKTTNARKASAPDFLFRDHGSLCILTPLSAEGKEWFESHLPVDNPETQFWAGGIVIERRYVPDVLIGLQSDGLTVAA
jgi:hypothetical protein